MDKVPLWQLTVTSLRHSQGDHHYYMMEMTTSETIDATYKGSIARLVNHSCEPNCMLQKWRNGNDTCVGLFAVRDISPGEELTYDYQFQFFGVGQVRVGGGECDRQGP